MNGHTVDCSLPLQSELIPTELILDTVMDRVATKYKTLHLYDIFLVTREIFM
jgi:hypothetical protein